MDRLFLDANVVFTAAHNPAGKAAFLFEHVAGQRATSRSLGWMLLSSAYAIEEARRNTVVKTPGAASTFDALMPWLEVVAQPVRARIVLRLPAKDEPIWSAALAAGASHLLTGDLRDFGAHMNRPEASAGVVIQTVVDYLYGR